MCLANSSHDTAAGKKEKEKKITSSSIPIPPSLLSLCGCGWSRLTTPGCFTQKLDRKRKKTKKKEWEIGVGASHPCPYTRGGLLPSPLALSL